MRKFVIHSLKGATSIMEVEIKLVTGLEDPSVTWLPNGEYKAHVLKPVSLMDKKVVVLEDKKTETQLVPPVYYSHAFYETAEEAMEVARGWTQLGFERGLSKHGEAFTPEDVEEKIKSIQVVRL